MSLRSVASVMVAVVLAAIVVVVPASAQAAAPAPASAPASALDRVEPVKSAAGFVHPGVFVTLDELTASKMHVEAGEAPWKTIYDQLVASSPATLGPPDFSQFASAADGSRACSADDPAGCVTFCGPHNIPSIGCSEELSDATAVYAQALLSWYTGDHAYAERAVSILNAYATHMKGHSGSNGPLMAAWIMQMMLRGAEILRYTYVPAAGEETFDVAAFSAMVRSAYVERLTSFDWYAVPSNWMASAADGLMNAAVFLDDRDLYDHALTLWRDVVPNYIYLTSDGEFPHFLDRSPIHDVGVVGTDTPQKQTDLKCLWLYNRPAGCQHDPKQDPGTVTLQNGQTQESCRDMTHSSMGLGSIINAAQTAWGQGDDLYGEQQERIMTAVSYATQISLNYDAHGWPTGFCNDASGLDGDVAVSSLAAEVAYNHYTVLKGARFATLAVPGYDESYPDDDPLAAYIQMRRTKSNPITPISAWETLTNHDIAAAPARPSAGSNNETPPQAAVPGRNASPAPGALVVPIGIGAVVVIGALAFVIRARRHPR